MLYCPSVLKHSSGVFMVRKAFSQAVSPLVSKILGDKRCWCMWLCVKANKQTHTHTNAQKNTYTLSIECPHTVVNLCFSLCSHQLQTELFLFFCHSPWKKSVVPGLECLCVIYTCLASQQQMPSGTVNDNKGSCLHVI